MFLTYFNFCSEVSGRNGTDEYSFFPILSTVVIKIADIKARYSDPFYLKEY